MYPHPTIEYKLYNLLKMQKKDVYKRQAKICLPRSSNCDIWCNGDIGTKELYCLERGIWEGIVERTHNWNFIRRRRYRHQYNTVRVGTNHGRLSWEIKPVFSHLWSFKGCTKLDQLKNDAWEFAIFSLVEQVYVYR